MATAGIHVEMLGLQSLPTLGPRQRSASCHQRGLWSRQRPSGLTGSLVLVSAEADEATATESQHSSVHGDPELNTKMPQPLGTSLSNVRPGSGFPSLVLQELEPTVVNTGLGFAL